VGRKPPTGGAQLTENRTDCTLPLTLEDAMAKALRRGAEEARNQLPELLTAAQHGRQTIITRHGRPVAVLTPISASGEATAQRSLLPLTGSGRGLYGRDSRVTLRRLRDEWNR
jgi:prevent-host-death family protein